jgi:hypothetical protein
MLLELVIPIGLLTQFSAAKLLLVKKMCQLGRTFLLEMLVQNELFSLYACLVWSILQGIPKSPQRSQETFVFWQD